MKTFFKKMIKYSSDNDENSSIIKLRALSVIIFFTFKETG